MNSQKLMQAYRQTPWRFQLQVIGLFLLVVVMIALIAGIYLNVTARAATIGRRIQFMQAEIQLVQRWNADLETRLALLTSASQMETRAKTLGFHRLQAGEVTYLVVDGYRGKQPVVLAPPHEPVIASAQTLPPEFTQSLIDWLRQFMLQPPSLPAGSER